MKSFIPVQFSFPTSSNAHSTDSIPATNDVKKFEEPKNPICPSCKTNLSNNKMLFGTCTLSASRHNGSHKLPVMRPCSHVVCKVCTDSLVRPASQCIVCDRGLTNLDIVELKREGMYAWSTILSQNHGLSRHSFVLTLFFFQVQGSQGVDLQRRQRKGSLFKDSNPRVSVRIGLPGISCIRLFREPSL